MFISTQKRPGSYALSMLILPAKASAVLGMVAVTGFLDIPYRILVARKDGNAEWGDYMFLVFLAYVIIGVSLGLIFGWYD